MHSMLVLALVVLVSVSACANDVPAWCGEYCRAVGAQTARCVPGSDRRTVEASCSAQLSCLTTTSIRSFPELSECLDALPEQCGNPDTCKLQFR